MSEVKRCPNCRTPYRTGEIVCQKCGMILIDPRLGTVHIRVSPDAIRLRRRSDDAPELPTLNERTLQLHIRGMSEQIAFEEGTSIVLGRLDPSCKEQETTCYDLTRFGAHERGVSRRHCLISYRDSQFLVTDLNSANGTFINRKRLQPSEAVRLNDGDELTLGSLMMIVRFNAPTAQQS
ncbi:MAG: FHA domain-containing protein [Chloroflexota bacterium]|nr:MAG: FHA domain-containing protein [Chloroflexota bacterium]